LAAMLHDWRWKTCTKSTPNGATPPCAVWCATASGLFGLQVPAGAWSQLSPLRNIQPTGGCRTMWLRKTSLFTF
jgi:hypothetical protein